MFFGNSQLSIEHEKSKFSILFLKNRNLPTVRFSCFLDRFISTFSHRNHSAKFRGLKLSTKKTLLQTILERTVGFRFLGAHFQFLGGSAPINAPAFYGGKLRRNT